MEQWSTVLFTDESRFTLRAPSGVEKEYGEGGEGVTPSVTLYNPDHIQRRVRVRGGISTQLVVVHGASLTAAQCTETILEPDALPIMNAGGRNVNFMQDNITHWTFSRTQCSGVAARPPDLNPIEYLSNMLGRRIRARIVLSETQQGLDLLKSGPIFRRIRLNPLFRAC